MDGEAFEVDRLAALESQVIKFMIEDDCADIGIPLPNLISDILSLVIEYCKKRAEFEAWDAEFLKVDQATLCRLFKAEDYLHVETLLDRTSQAVIDMIKGKTPEEICKKFNKKFEFTQEEEEKLRRQNQWASEN